MLQVSAVDEPEEEWRMENPNQPEESPFTGLPLGDQDQSFQEALRRWRADRAGGLERTAGSPGKWRHSRQAFQGT